MSRQPEHGIPCAVLIASAFNEKPCSVLDGAYNFLFAPKPRNRRAPVEKGNMRKKR